MFDIWLCEKKERKDTYWKLEYKSKLITFDHAKANRPEKMIIYPSTVHRSWSMILSVPLLSLTYATTAKKYSKLAKWKTMHFPIKFHSCGIRTYTKMVTSKNGTDTSNTKERQTKCFKMRNSRHIWTRTVEENSKWKSDLISNHII